MELSNKIFVWGILTLLVGCYDSVPLLWVGGGGGSSDSTPPPSELQVPQPFNLQSVSASSASPVGTFPVTLVWDTAQGATTYTVCRKDQTQVDSCEPLATTTQTSATVNVTGALKDHLSNFFIKALNQNGSTLSNERSLTPSDVVKLIAYLKASNTDAGDSFGRPVSMSEDGSTLAIGAYLEASSTSGINTTPDNLASSAGAVYIFRYSAGQWSQQAYVKPSNTQSFDAFGWSLALSADGNTLAVGAYGEDSSTTGVNSTPNESASRAGAVYIFRYTAGSWSEEAYIKASNTDAFDYFSWFLALSGDGDTLAVGAIFESSSTSGINSTPDNLLLDTGAVYVYRFSGGNWTQQAYIKASNSGASDSFGYSVSLSSDGNTLAVGSPFEDSNTTGINSTPNDLVNESGAAYVFRYSAGAWSQQAYIKASNTGDSDQFGWSVYLSDDGNVLAVSGRYEDSSTTGVNTTPDDGALDSGAVYIFRFTGGSWAEEAYLKASNTGAGDYFGWSVALSSAGDSLAVSAREEDSSSVGINSVPDEGAADAGAVYMFHYDNGVWGQQAYVKASNTGAGDRFGVSVALGKNGEVLAVGAFFEDSSTTGIDSTSNESAANAGATYIF